MPVPEAIFRHNAVLGLWLPHGTAECHVIFENDGRDLGYNVAILRQVRSSPADIDYFYGADSRVSGRSLVKNPPFHQLRGCEV